MSDNLKLENGRYWCTLCGKKETTAIKFDAQVVSLCDDCIACLVKRLNERLRTTMTKQFEFEEYEKLSDVIKDWKNGEQIYREINGVYSACIVPYNTIVQFWTSDKYAKRVEIKEKTVEAWAAISGAGSLVEVSFSEIEIFDRYQMKVDRYGYKIVKLTGTIEGAMPKANNKREYLVEDDRGHGGQLGV